DLIVTGVQTCALPIWSARGPRVVRVPESGARRPRRRANRAVPRASTRLLPLLRAGQPRASADGASLAHPHEARHLLSGPAVLLQIGRASCRERGASAG